MAQPAAPHRPRRPTATRPGRPVRTGRVVAMQPLPNGNRVVDGKVMSWVYKLKSIESESPVSASQTTRAARAAPALSPYSFTLSPEFACGDSMSFDLEQLSSTNAPFAYPDQLAVFVYNSLVGVDHYTPLESSTTE